MRRVHLLMALFCLTLLNTAAPAQAGVFPTVVLGQPGLAVCTAADPPTATSQRGPIGVAFDPISGKLYVADTGNHRVLRYSSGTAWSTGQAAEAVFGQPTFTSRVSAAGATGMSLPHGVAVDSAGRLWVADSFNQRVLRFDDAATRSNGANADGVLGQPNLESRTSATSRNGFTLPVALAADANGRLWVVDAQNSRVLRFDAAASKANGADADGVLGQADFTSGIGGLAANRLNQPFGVAVDGNQLWVAEAYNRRVLRFENAASKPNGADADGVLGQPDFTTRTVGSVTRRTVSEVVGLAIANGQLWVADSGNHRVLRFDNAASKTNGADADALYGQWRYTERFDGCAMDRFNYPQGLALDPTNQFLWVADGANHRTVQFAANRPDIFVYTETVDGFFDIEDGDTTPRTEDQTDFGTLDVTNGSKTTLFAIGNIGDQPLTFAQPAVSISGVGAADYTVTQPNQTTLESVAFVGVSITFNPSVNGPRDAVVTIRSNAQSPRDVYTFAITGRGTGGQEPTNTPTASPTSTPTQTPVPGQVLPHSYLPIVRR